MWVVACVFGVCDDLTEVNCTPNIQNVRKNYEIKYTPQQMMNALVGSENN